MKITHIHLSGPFTKGLTYQENLLSKHHKLLGFDVSVITNQYSYNDSGSLILIKERIEFTDDGRKIIRLPIKNNKKLKHKFKRYEGLYETLLSEKPLEYYDNNVYGLQCLLKTMKNNNVKKIIFSSSAATYGEPDEIPIIETNDTNPTNTYGETKLAMEKMMKWVDKAHGIKYVSLRYFNASGAHPSGNIGEDHTPETHLIPLVLQVPLGLRKQIYIFGDDYETKDGTCIRDYIHVMDLASVHYLAIKYLKDGNDSNIFNLGSGEGYSVKEIIEISRTITGHPIPATIKKRRDGDPAILIASSDKAKKILKWEPKYNTIEKIITDSWNWHSSNPTGYKK